MLKYTITRLLALVPVLLILSVVVFGIMRLIPGDPVQIMYGGEADAAAVAATRSRLGLDRPLPAQYGFWLVRILQGDLGRSLRAQQPVSQALAQRLPVTLELTVLALVLAVLIALPLGVVAALRRNTVWDVAASTVALVGLTVPNFFLGILLIQVFSLKLHWLPSLGYVALPDSPVQNLRYMIMPAMALALGLAAVVMRITRSSLLEVLTQEYILVARSKGLRERSLVYHHALRNALIPVVTLLGLQMGALLGGAVLTETVFGLPGIGRLLVDSIFARDFPIVQATMLFLVIGRVLSSLVVDLSYAALDPRIKFG